MDEGLASAFPLPLPTALTLLVRFFFFFFNVVYTLVGDRHHRHGTTKTVRSLGSLDAARGRGTTLTHIRRTHAVKSICTTTRQSFPDTARTRPGNQTVLPCSSVTNYTVYCFTPPPPTPTKINPFARFISAAVLFFHFPSYFPRYVARSSDSRYVSHEFPHENRQIEKRNRQTRGEIDSSRDALISRRKRDLLRVRSHARVIVPEIRR